MNEMQKYIILNGLKINNVPQPDRPDRAGTKGRHKNNEATNMRTIRERVMTYEEALGIEIMGRWKHGTRLAGIIPVREQ